MSRPLDLTKGRRYFKGGATAENIVRTVLTGLSGTPMPSYDDVFTSEQIWALAYYVEYLVDQSRK